MDHVADWKAIRNQEFFSLLAQRNLCQTLPGDQIGSLALGRLLRSNVPHPTAHALNSYAPPRGDMEINFLLFILLAGEASL